jgi:hypothetical protein
MILSGIEHANFRLVAQCLNKLRYRVPWSSCKATVILVRVQRKLHFSDRFFGKYSNSFFMKIRLVGVKLFHTDRLKDMTKLIVAFRNFVNAPKKIQENVSDTLYHTAYIHENRNEFFLRRWSLFQKSAVYKRWRPKLFNILYLTY